MNDPNSREIKTNHEISRNNIKNSEIDAANEVDSSVSQFSEKIKARNINKIKTQMKMENGNSTDRYYQFIERLLILLGFGSPTVVFLNYDWLKT